MIGDRDDLPWFKFHVGDYLRVTRAWPPAARLAYVELLCAQWDGGSLPIDATAVRAFVPGLTEAEWAVSWPFLDAVFPSDGHARRNAAFARLRDKQSQVNTSRRQAAKTAAAQRWQERTGVDPDA